MRSAEYLELLHHEPLPHARLCLQVAVLAVWLSHGCSYLCGCGLFPAPEEAPVPKYARKVPTKEMQRLAMPSSISYTRRTCIFNKMPAWSVVLTEREIATLDCFHFLNIAFNSEGFTLKET